MECGLRGVTGGGRECDDALECRRRDERQKQPERLPEPPPCTSRRATSSALRACAAWARGLRAPDQTRGPPERASRSAGLEVLPAVRRADVRHREQRGREREQTDCEHHERAVHPSDLAHGSLPSGSSMRRSRSARPLIAPSLATNGRLIGRHCLLQKETPDFQASDARRVELIDLENHGLLRGRRSRGQPMSTSVTCRACEGDPGRLTGPGRRA